MTKTFDNPHRLGWIRFWQVYFGLDVALNILALVLFVKSSYHFDFQDYIDYSEVICSGVIFWLIYQRKRVTRYVVPVVTILFVVVNFIGSYFFAGGSFDFLFFLDPFIWLRIVAAIYFLVSRRVRAQLTRPFNVEGEVEHSKKRKQLWQPRTWAFWRNLIIYFCVFSVVGHWLEALYCTLIRFGILPGVYDPNSQIWSDWLYPFVVYGIGAVACILLLYPIRNFLLAKTGNLIVALLISFVINTLVCTSIELVMGLILNQPDAAGNLPLWDYRTMPFNFMGQVCLQNALAFGIVATLMVWVFYPLLENFLSRFSNDVMQIAFMVIVVFFSVLMALYCVKYVIVDITEESFD